MLKCFVLPVAEWETWGLGDRGNWGNALNYRVHQDTELMDQVSQCSVLNAQCSVLNAKC
jgi:hypothetical protein